MAQQYEVSQPCPASLLQGFTNKKSNSQDNKSIVHLFWYGMVVNNRNSKRNRFGFTFISPVYIGQRLTFSIKQPQSTSPALASSSLSTTSSQTNPSRANDSHSNSFKIDRKQVILQFERVVPMENPNVNFQSMLPINQLLWNVSLDKIFAHGNVLLNKDSLLTQRINFEDYSNLCKYYMVMPSQVTYSKSQTLEKIPNFVINSELAEKIPKTFSAQNAFSARVYQDELAQYNKLRKDKANNSSTPLKEPRRLVIHKQTNKVYYVLDVMENLKKATTNDYLQKYFGVVSQQVDNKNLERIYKEMLGFFNQSNFDFKKQIFLKLYDFIRDYSSPKPLTNEFGSLQNFVEQTHRLTKPNLRDSISMDAQYCPDLLFLVPQEADQEHNYTEGHQYFRSNVQKFSQSQKEPKRFAVNEIVLSLNQDLYYLNMSVEELDQVCYLPSLATWFERQVQAWEFKSKYQLQYIDNYYMMKALCSKGFDPVFNNETLETVGDTILKTLVTLLLYVQNPSAGPSQLTDKRVKLIENIYLGKIATANNFMFQLQNKMQKIKNGFVPPYFKFDDLANKSTGKAIGLGEQVHHKERNLEDFWCSKQIVSSKMLADCFEALIGASFHSSQRLYEPLDFMRKMNHLPNFDFSPYREWFSFKFDFGDDLIDKMVLSVNLYEENKKKNIDDDQAIINECGIPPIKDDFSFLDLRRYSDFYITLNEENYINKKQFREAYQRRKRIQKEKQALERGKNPKNHRKLSQSNQSQQNSLLQAQDLIEQSRNEISQKKSKFTNQNVFTNLNKIADKSSYLKESLYRQKENEYVEQFERSLIGYKFKNKATLVDALKVGSPEFERLEFIGDAFIELITLNLARKVFIRLKKNYKPEMLHSLKMSLLSNETLAKFMVGFGLHNYILTDHLNMATQQSFQNYLESTNLKQSFSRLWWHQSVEAPKGLADCYEALIGALFVDGGWPAVNVFFRNMVLPFVVFVCKYEGQIAFDLSHHIITYHDKQGLKCAFEEDKKGQKKMKLIVYHKESVEMCSVPMDNKSHKVARRELVFKFMDLYMEDIKSEKYFSRFK